MANALKTRSITRLNAVVIAMTIAGGGAFAYALYSSWGLTQVTLADSRLLLFPGQFHGLDVHVMPLTFKPVVFFTTNDSSVATISGEGTITAVTIGRATVHAKLESGREIGTCIIEVVSLGEYLQRTYTTMAGNASIDPANNTHPGHMLARFIEDHLSTRVLGEKKYHETVSRQEATFLWDIGIQLANLAEASNQHPDCFKPALDAFRVEGLPWYRDSLRGGYQPCFKPSLANDDRYYDDNAWVGMALIYAYEATGETSYLDLASQLFQFLKEGQDTSGNATLDGGIYWHVTKKSINTCSTAPAAFFCLQLSRYLDGETRTITLEMADKAIEWCMRAMQDPADRLFFDNLRVIDGHVDTRKFTYNTAMMERALLLRAQITDNATDLGHAIAIANASDYFFDTGCDCYVDDAFFAYLLVEANVELYRHDHANADFLFKALATGNHYWDMMHDPSHVEYFKTCHLKTIAAMARVFWVLGTC
nr:glycoside hydrolase family 76 protein [Candidatus Sigynarchaeota archaeon]